jgi:hypothetical protein
LNSVRSPRFLSQIIAGSVSAVFDTAAPEVTEEIAASATITEAFHVYKLLEQFPREVKIPS